MPQRQPALPRLWLISDQRNDAALEASLAKVPRGSGFIFRHYHLEAPARRARFERLKRLARRYGHWIVLAGSIRQARQWGADGAYGSPSLLAGGPAFPRFATAHDLREIGSVRRATAILLSPAFPTASHRDAKTLGPTRFRALAARAKIPVIALGGMVEKRARRMRWNSWAAIDGLTVEPHKTVPPALAP